MRRCSAGRRTRPQGRVDADGTTLGAGCTVREASGQPLPPSSWPTATTVSRSLLDRYAARSRRRSCRARLRPPNFGDSDGSRGRSSNRGYRSATTATRSRSCRRWTASTPSASVVGHELRGRPRPRRRRDRPARALRGLPGADDQRLGVDAAPDRAAGAAGPARGIGRRSPRALRGRPPKMVPMVVDPPPAARPRTRAPTRGSSSPARTRRRGQWRFKKWRNEITLRSLELYSEYEPGSFIERIAPTPLLMVLGDADVVCPTDLGLAPSTAPASRSDWSSTPAVTSPPTPNSSTRGERRDRLVQAASAALTRGRRSTSRTGIRSRNPMSEVSDQLRAAALARARSLQAARKAFISARSRTIRLATPLYFFVIPMTVRLTAPWWTRP